MNYYLKNADATRMYRLEYNTNDEGGIAISGSYACATGSSAVLPNQNPITQVDEIVPAEQVMVDLIINSLVAGTVTEYRTLAKAMTDLKWS